MIFRTELKEEVSEHEKLKEEIEKSMPELMGEGGGDLDAGAMGAEV